MSTQPPTDLPPKKKVFFPYFSSSVQTVLSTHQADQQEENLEASAESGDTDHVPISHRGHGDHQEVDAVPVGKALAVGETWWVARVLQLCGRRAVTMNLPQLWFVC